MDIQDIQIFARVAAVQSLSQVAIELSLTPGTISKRLQALEHELSVRLFDRTTRSIRITAEGSRFLVHVERILAELERARATVADTTGRPKGRLRVVASQALSRSILNPAVMDFLQTYPEIEVHIDLTDRMINLLENGYDVAVVSGAPADSSLTAKRLANDRQIIVAAPSYLAEQGMPLEPDDVAVRDCLAMSEAWTWTLRDADGADTMVRINSRLRSDNSEFLLQAALAGRGLLMASELHIREQLEAGRLVRVLPGHEVAADSGVFALYPGGKHVLPRLRVFLNFLADWFSRDVDARGRSPCPGHASALTAGR